MTLLKLLPESEKVLRCIWKDITYAINIGNDELERCRTLCDGYNVRCQYYFTKEGKYDKHKRSM